MAIIIPKLNVKAAVIDGTEGSALKIGPGLYKESDLPNENRGNVSIAAHNDSWFKSIYKLEKGDIINLIFQGKEYIYVVQNVFDTKNNDWSVINSTDIPTITLTTCHPITGRQQRVVVKGILKIQ